MSYTKNVWANGDKVTAKKLNNIENGIEELDNKTKIVEKWFKELGSYDEFILNVGEKITKNNLLNNNTNSMTYQFTSETKKYYFYYNNNKDKFIVSTFNDEDNQLIQTNEVDEVCFEEEVWLEDCYDENGTNPLGTWTDKQLTAQEAYDDLNATINDLNNDLLNVADIVNEMDFPFKNRDVFSTGELQDETIDNYVTLRLSGNVESLKPIYICANTSAGAIRITILNLLDGSKSIYIVNENGETRTMPFYDFVSSYYVGERAENFLMVDIFGAIKLFGNIHIDNSDEALLIEYEESKSGIELEL